MPHLDIAKRVLKQECEGLEQLSEALGEGFVQLIDKIDEVTSNGGRVILSGMGKSGHVANKIAATMASTGTPSFAVHPGEASHGDMGMITNKDIVILLSNSGETHELKDIIAYCKRFGIFLVGMVRRKESSLVGASDIALILPATPEANQVNAPTTSTTMMMALGDAIAVALLENRGFEDEDFKVFHPGGKLGAQLMTIAELMHVEGEMPLVEEGKTMAEALVAITGKKFGCGGVVSAYGELVGIVTDGDIRRHMDADFLQKSVKDVMTANPKTVSPQTMAAKALKIMEDNRITSLFVTDGGKAKGIVHIHDLLRAGVS